MNHRLKLPIILLIILVVSCQLSIISCYGQSSKYIRVAIAQDVVSLSLRVDGSYEIIDSVSQKILSRGKNLKTTVIAYKDGILIGGKNFDTNKLSIKKEGSSDIIMIDGRTFRGEIQFIKKDNWHLLVINYIDLEDYIKGILYHEASHYWPSEALKAQAVVSRTYAAYQMQESCSKDYDVTSDIYSQVYGGRISERYRTNKAVDETKSQILTYQDKIFPTYYHATCAGYTEDASLLWNIDMLPLRGIRCTFCQDSPHFRWHVVLSQKQIKDALVKSGYAEAGNIKDIVILDRDSSSRITSLRIVNDREDINISAKDFRNIIGPNIIRSTNFNLNIVNHDLVFEGLGWGHGVGLCQWGAYFMAKQGHKYDEILKYYYPGTELSLIANKTVEN